MYQGAFIEALLQQHGLHLNSATSKSTPYWTRSPVDAIKIPLDITPNQQFKLQSILRSLVGSFNWLAQATRPDLATITSILAQHQENSALGHMGAARPVLCYLNATKTLGISLQHSDKKFSLQSFVHFPVQGKIQLVAAEDATWGPQDQSQPSQHNNHTLELLQTRLISGHMIALHGPLHWSFKRQKITVQSSAEAEIYATDYCVQDIQFLSHIIKDLNLQKTHLHTLSNYSETIWRACFGPKTKQPRISVTYKSMETQFVNQLKNKKFPSTIRQVQPAYWIYSLKKAKPWPCSYSS